jgi:CBS domain-containing protein
MTPFPYAIDIDEPVIAARSMMKHHGIRHLPVKEKGELAGVITDRDIKKMMGPDFTTPQEKELTVRQVFIEDAYTVDLREPLDNVLLHMANHHIGSAIVTKNGNLVGLFTVTDACRVFSAFLREHFLPTPGNDAA